MNEQPNEPSQEFRVDGLTLPSISDAPIYIQREKERHSIKMPPSVNVNEVLTFGKYVRNPEPVVKLWYGNFIQIPKCATFTFLQLQIAFPIWLCMTYETSLYALFSFAILISDEVVASNCIRKHSLNLAFSNLPMSEQFGFPHWWVPASSFPSLSTHQHLPDISWHWTGSNEPSRLQLGTNKLIGVLLRMVIALLFSFWHGVIAASRKKKRKMKNPLCTVFY